MDRVGSVIVVAYAFGNDSGSEPEAGWQFVRAWASLAREVIVVTRENNVHYESAVEANVQVRGFDLPSLLLKVKKHLPFFGTQIYAFAWHLAVRSYVRQFDLTDQETLFHHVTFGSDWMPCAIPPSLAENTIWGPVGGFTRFQPSVFRWLGLAGSFTYTVRWLLTNLLRRLSLSLNNRHIAVVLANYPDSARNLGRLGYENVEIQHHSYISDSWGGLFVRESAIKNPGKVLVGIGRLVPWKGWSVAISALAHLPDSYTLVIVGSGRDRRRLQRLADAKRLGSRVVFQDQLARSEVMQQLASADILVHPSLHDSSPFAVAEAIHLGKPFVVLDKNGSGYLASIAGIEPVVFPQPNLPLAFAAAISEAQRKPDRTCVMDTTLPNQIEKIIERIVPS